MLLWMSLTLISGCAPYAESFDCDPGKGVGCKALSTVNQMVEEGELPLPEIPLQKTSGQEIPNWIEAKSGNKPHSLLSHQGFPQDIPHSKSHLKIWVTAYEDENQIYHTPSYVYAAVGVRE